MWRLHIKQIQISCFPWKQALAILGPVSKVVAAGCSWAASDSIKMENPFL